MAFLRRTVLPAVLLAVSPVVRSAADALAAQTGTAGADTAAATTAALDALTAADLRRHVQVLAHDSMLASDTMLVPAVGGDTSHGGLERAARYVAAQFQALGLAPVGDSGTWLQRYPRPGHATVDDGRSKLTIIGRAQRDDRPVVDELGDRLRNIQLIDFRDVIVATDTLLDERAPGARGGGQVSGANWDFSGPAPMLVAGPHTPASLQQANLHDKVVVYIPPAGLDSATERRMIERLRASNHVIVVVDDDSAAFAARRARTRTAVVLEPYLPEAQPLHRWAVYVRASAIAAPLATGGVELAEVRAVSTPLVRAVGGWAGLQARRAPLAVGPTLLNTVGLLRGSGDQMVVITAHLGRGAGAGVAELLTLASAAAAFQRAGGALGRSLVFAAVSGGPGEYWGSQALIEQSERQQVGRFVLDLHLGGLGGGRRDTLAIAGLQDVALATPPAWLATQHAELQLAVVDGGSVVTAEGDQLAFVQQAIPSLRLHGGEPGAEPGAAGANAAAPGALAVDAEPAARALRFVFTLAREVAAAPTAPKWTTEGHRRRFQVFGR